MGAEYCTNIFQEVILEVLKRVIQKGGLKLTFEQLDRFGYICLAEISGKWDLIWEEEMLG